jgi:dihydroorotase
MGRIIIQQGRVLDPASQLDSVVDVAIEGQSICAIAPNIASAVDDQVIDARGLWVLPGLVDIATRLREPGFEFKSALESELSAAVAGGVTALACLPDTDPVLDEPGLVKMLKFRAQSLNRAKVFPLGALTLGLQGEVITEMAELMEAGCIGFTQANHALIDTQVLLRSMQYAKSFGFRLWLQPTDPYLGRGGVAHSGAVASRLGLSGVPVSAEVIAVQTILELVRATGCSVHLCRLSSSAGLALVRAAKKEGLPITADVAIHNALLTDIDIGYFDSRFRVTPPLRAQRDRDAIWQAIADGTIDVICSDHTPVDSDAKLLPFAEADPGVTGLELLLPLALRLQRLARIELKQIIQALTVNPAVLLGQTASVSGQLSIGAAADIVLFNPAQTWIAQPNELLSQGKHTPFSHQELEGRCVGTWVNGAHVYSLQAAAPFLSDAA